MSFAISAARILYFERPIERPVVTAFGRMDARHAVVLELQDGEGRTGIGENWVNFPYWAAFERTVAFERGYLPYLRGREVGDVAEFSAAMFRAFEGPAAQSGTTGPLLSALCAVECALWDLAAQREGVPLRRLLFDSSADSVRVYASGINAPLPFALIDEHLAKGVTLFKLKLGFGDAADCANLEALARHLAGRARIAVDVNRGWTWSQALAWLDALAELDVEWLEEPLRPEDEHRLAELSAQDKVSIAAGENIQTPPGRPGAPWPCDVLQPDVTKYAPLSVAVRLLGDAARVGKRVVPHMLGSAPGLAVSLHLAAGCPDALCEMDINRNPLRTDLCEPPFDIRDGRIRLSSAPGLGWRLRADGP